MNSDLHVGAVIDSPYTAEWVHRILNTINTSELMQLDVAVLDSSVDTYATHSAKKPPRNLGDWLVERVVDNPNFTHDPWQVLALADSLPISNLVTHPDALAHCDVILHLTPQALPDSMFKVQIPVWSVKLETLDRRVKYCLVHRAPFIWIHIWNRQVWNKQDIGSRQDSADAKTCPEVRIASHALPCQTYSISDLRRLSYSALPGILFSRLVWLANSSTHKLEPIDVQYRNQGVFIEDQQLARLDADNTEPGYADGISTKSVQTLGNAVKLLLNKTKDRLHHRIFTEHWQLAVSHNPVEHRQSVHDVVKKPVHEYATFAEPPDVTWADPHLFEHDGDTYVFFEKMHAHHQNAHIAYAKLDQYGKPISFGDALVEDHHLSFPFVFSEGGNHYMVPETASQRNIYLYKATHFPDQWEKHATLLRDINAADTVLVRHTNRWWMFTNFQSHFTVDERDELHLFYADTLDGPWQAHALNPVLTGVDRSRMAGPILEENGALYRTSQYGAYRYGYGINISQIVELTPTTYREIAVQRIVPEKGAGWSGCHSFGRLGNLTIIDRVRFSWR